MHNLNEHRAVSAVQLFNSVFSLTPKLVPQHLHYYSSVQFNLTQHTHLRTNMSTY